MNEFIAAARKLEAEKRLKALPPPQLFTKENLSSTADDPETTNPTKSPSVEKNPEKVEARRKAYLEIINPVKKGDPNAPPRPFNGFKLFLLHNRVLETVREAKEKRDNGGHVELDLILQDKWNEWNRLTQVQKMPYWKQSDVLELDYKINYSIYKLRTVDTHTKKKYTKRVQKYEGQKRDDARKEARRRRKEREERSLKEFNHGAHQHQWNEGRIRRNEKEDHEYGPGRARGFNNGAHQGGDRFQRGEPVSNRSGEFTRRNK
ncbi:hypothetical protein BDR26DRAFT_862845 [Obelidium mucronatum]|nr:hypothetical protein BDR26DRAFT_862845 [Obelidium mucronatum]